MVLLGFIDEPKGGKTGADDDPSNWTISRIGGQAAFPSTDIASKVKSSLVCAKCQQEQLFVCQLYCPLQGHRYDRALYLFACRNPSCWNTTQSWTAVRCQKFDDFVEESISSDEEEPPASVPPSSKDWGDDADAWNTDEDDNRDAVVQTKSPSSTKKKEIKIEPEVNFKSMTITDDDQEDAAKSSSDEDEIDLDSKKKSQAKNVSVASSDAFNGWKRRNLQQATAELTGQDQFPFYYIDIDEEEAIVNDAKLAEQKKLKKKCQQIDEDDGDDEDTTKRGKEKYEKTPDIEHGDLVFYRFQQKIRYAPDQIIRYDWSGQPLILTKTESSAQKCRHCQSPCYFEFQLMPALVNYLKIKQQVALEFGTVFIYTCSKNCWNDQEDLYRLENVFVQADPDQSLFD